MFSFVNMTTANDSLKQLVSSTDGTMEGKVREQVHQAHDQHHIPSSPSSSPSSTNTIGLEQIQEARLRIGLPLSSIYAQFFGTFCLFVISTYTTRFSNYCELIAQQC
jgi:hypothetical protein